jgi:hypothetical protein
VDNKQEMLENELVRKENAERQHKKQKRQKIQVERVACEQKRLNIGCTVSRWGIGHQTGEAVQKCEEAGKQAEEAG